MAKNHFRTSNVRNHKNQESEIAMKRIFVVLAMAVCCAAGAQAQMSGGPAVAAGSQVAPAATFDALLSQTEGQMVSLVKAMPANTFNFAPSASIFVPSQKTEYAGVRTFAALVIHVTQANYGIGGRISGAKPDVDMASLAGVKDKDQIVAALEASFAFVHKQIATLTPANSFESVRGSQTRISMAAFVTVHASDEYGQMVEYLRMNGLVPPASEKKGM